MPSAPVIPYDRYKCSSPQQPCLLDPIPICSHCSYRLFLLQITSQHTSELRLSILGTVHSPPWTPLAGLHHTRSEAAIYQLEQGDRLIWRILRGSGSQLTPPSPPAPEFLVLILDNPARFVHAFTSSACSRPRYFTVRSHLHPNKKHLQTVPVTTLQLRILGSSGHQHHRPPSVPRLR